MPKTGKTRLACTFPKPLLIIGAEDGTASVVGMEGVEFVRIESCAEFTELVEGPVAEGRWATVVLDTATKMRDIRIRELFASMGMEEPPDKKPFIYADQTWKQVWVQCGKDLRDMWAPFFDLPRRMPLNIIIIAQEQNIQADDSTSDIIRPAVGSALGKSLCLFVNAECDYIGQTLIRCETVNRAVVVAGKKVEKQVKTGKKQYCLRVGPDEIYMTGFRQTISAPPLPDFIVDPTYSKIAQLIEGS